MCRERKLNRLRNGNYSKPGWYFVTVCSKNREEVFGEIIEKAIMPNHIHMLIWIKIEAIEHRWLVCIGQ